MGGTWQYVLPDDHGSVRQLSDGIGTVAGAQHYDPFGTPTDSYGSASSVFGFTGEPHDPTGLIHLRARYYSPQHGRFLSVDPFEGMAKQPYNLHPYQYAYGNPTRYKDPSGYVSEELGLFNFKIGKPVRPANIQHDNGFLDVFEPRDPTFNDYVQLAKWEMKLAGARIMRSDLQNGLDAYDHFLHGNGIDRDFNYNEFVDEDESGMTIVKNALRITQEAVELLCETRNSCRITSDGVPVPVTIGGTHFPYPETENWQKTIGAHWFWISADINIETGACASDTYSMKFVLHAEDRYNFNPGQKDIATGIPDEANGIFELTGLAKQYMHYSEYEIEITWTKGDIDNHKETP